MENHTTSPENYKKSHNLCWKYRKSHNLSWRLKNITQPILRIIENHKTSPKIIVSQKIMYPENYRKSRNLSQNYWKSHNLS